MKALYFNVSGKYGHFKIPYTNNNPHTHSFITKTALIGMIGAVVGIDRKDMKKLFPILSDNLKYGVSLQSPVKKEPIGFITAKRISWPKDKNGNDIINDSKSLSGYQKEFKKAPKYFEYLKNPNFNILVAFTGEDKKSESIFDEFCNKVKNSLCVISPYLGVQNCFCNIKYISNNKIEVFNGEFETYGFIADFSLLSKNIPDSLYKESIPTYQDDNWYNPKDKYINVYFTDNKTKMKSIGLYYKFNNDDWYLC